MPRQGRLLCRSRSVFLPSAPSFLTTQQGCHRLVVPPMGDPQSVEEERWLRKNEGLPAETEASGTRVGQGDEHALANVSRRHILHRTARTFTRLSSVRKRGRKITNKFKRAKARGKRRGRQALRQGLTCSRRLSFPPHATVSPPTQTLHQPPRSPPPPFSTCVRKRSPAAPVRSPNQPVLDRRRRTARA